MLLPFQPPKKPLLQERLEAERLRAKVLMGHGGTDALQVWFKHLRSPKPQKGLGVERPSCRASSEQNTLAPPEATQENP